MGYPIVSAYIYRDLEESGLVEKCRSTSDIWSTMITMGLVSDEANEIYGTLSEKLLKTDFERDVFLFRDEIDSIDDKFFCGREKQFAFVEYPLLLSYAAVGDSLESFSDYGFDTREEMEKVVSVLCVGDRKGLDSGKLNHYFQWRNSGFQSQLSNSNHGDFSTMQVDTRFEEKWKYIDGFNGFGGGQCGWGPFLIGILKYAKTIDAMDIPEIKNWKDHADGVESFWSDIDCKSVLPEFDGLRDFIDHDILGEGLPSGENFPIRTNSDGGGSYYPYVMDEKLFFISPSESGEMTIDTNYRLLKDKKLEVRSEFCREDLPYLMKGIYNLYARDRSQVPGIMKIMVDGEA